MFAQLRGKSLVINQAIVLLVFLILAGIGFFSLHAMKKSADQMGQGKDVVADILPPPLYLIEAQLVSNDLLQATTAERAPLIEKLRALKKDYDERNQFWETSGLDQTLASNLLGEQRKQGELFWKEALEHFIPAIRANDSAAASASAKTLRRYYEAHRQGVDSTVNLGNKYAGEKFESLTATAKQAYLQLGVAAGLGCALVLLLSVPTINRIYRSLRAAGEAATAIAAGDLTHTMPTAGTDEVGTLITQIAGMRDQLRALITAVHQNVEIVAQSAVELSVSATSSAQASGLQSEAASSIAAEMQELSTAINRVEEHSQAARGATLDSQVQSEEGGRIIHGTADEMRLIAGVVNSAAHSLRELEDLSSRISTIVCVIKEIADQTNLLALNAAIEAARAGEQGRGFAVVADEVRKLAERTAHSTQEITDMIAKIQLGTQCAVQEMESGVQRVNEGVELANKAGDSVTGIRTGSEHVARAVDEITVALKAQVSTTRKISSQVEQIAQSAEQNSVTAIQTATSAGQLEGFAKQLSALAGKFRIA